MLTTAKDAKQEVAHGAAVATSCLASLAVVSTVIFCSPLSFGAVFQRSVQQVGFVAHDFSP
ncbi:hypothetical protein MAHJHV47_46740 [Mycobacterium avium subsp. hominissuis]